MTILLGVFWTMGQACARMWLLYKFWFQHKRQNNRNRSWSFIFPCNPEHWMNFSLQSVFTFCCIKYLCSIEAVALQRQGDNEKLCPCAVEKISFTSINSLSQVSFTWLHYTEFFSWGQASPTWTRLMQNTEKEKLLMKVNSPQLCFLRGCEIQVFSIMWLTRVILFWRCLF